MKYLITKLIGSEWYEILILTMLLKQVFETGV